MKCERGHEFIPCTGDSCQWMGHTSVHPNTTCHYMTGDIGVAGPERCGGNSLEAERHVFWFETDTDDDSLVIDRCCNKRRSDPIHVPEKIEALKHGDRVYLRQIVTPQAINSILERLDKIETFLVIP